METDFSPQPHAEAIALILGKPAVSRAVFDQMLTELRGRVFAITGIESANTLQRARDIIAKLPAGATWDEVKGEMVQEISPYFGEGEAGDMAANRRAELLMRTHGFQAFESANWRVAQEDEDTTHIQYLATEDTHVRATHLALNGIVLPKNDPFWDKHTPPWEWGCRCRIRPMNPDMVDEARTADEKRAPDNKLVMEGPALTKLREGTLIRDGQTYSVIPPSETNKENAYQWNPNDYRISLAELEQRYDPEVFKVFREFAEGTQIEPGVSVWDWLKEEKSQQTEKTLQKETKGTKGTEKTNAPAPSAVRFSDWTTADKWGNENFPPSGLNLKATEKAALVSYQNSAMALNRKLQTATTGDFGSFADQVKELDRVMERARLPQAAIVWHGSGSSFWATAKPGDEMAIKSFMSTTLNERFKGFAETAWIEIHVPAGARSVFMDDLNGSNRVETELLLDRKGLLRVKSVAQQGGKLHIVADLVQPE